MLQQRTLRQLAPQVTAVALASIATVSAVLYAGRTATALPQSTDTVMTVRAGPGSGFADLVEAVRPAVVNISIRTVQHMSARPDNDNSDNSFSRRHGQEFGFRGQPQMREFMERFFGEAIPRGPRGSMEARSLGSGFIIDAAGLVVTNHHVIGNADEIEVVLEDGRVFPATVRGSDQRTDLALLEIDANEPLPYVSFGDSDHARVGDWVIAIGNPFGLGGTTTSGIVSARGRDINSGPYVDYIQIDASINRGNSGGPLFNNAGEVIGVNTAIFSPNGGSVGIGFAIPASVAQNVISQLRDSGQVARAWLGVEIQTVGPDIAHSLGLDEPRGALVSRISPNSPAARSDLRTGDVIVSLNNEPVKRMRHLPRLIARTATGQSVSLGVWRSGQEMMVTATLEPLRGSRQALDQQEQEPTRKLGLKLSMLDEANRQRLGKNRNGVLIQDVTPQSPAARKGLRPGDIILKVGENPVGTPEDVLNQVDLARADQQNKAILLLVERNGEQRYVAVKTG
jgi:serine protease Do